MKNKILIHETKARMIVSETLKAIHPEVAAKPGPMFSVMVSTSLSGKTLNLEARNIANGRGMDIDFRGKYRELDMDKRLKEFGLRLMRNGIDEETGIPQYFLKVERNCPYTDVANKLDSAAAFASFKLPKSVASDVVEVLNNLAVDLRDMSEGKEESA
jgi:hypothetical protein